MWRSSPICGKLTVNMPVFIAATVTVAFSVDIRKTVRTLDMPLPDGCSTGGSCSHTVVVFKRFVLESIVLVVRQTLSRRGKSSKRQVKAVQGKKTGRMI